MKRRDFLKTTAAAGIALGMMPTSLIQANPLNLNKNINWVWTRSGILTDKKKTRKMLMQLNKAKIQGIFAAGTTEEIEELAPLARRYAIKVYSRQWILNKNDEKLIKKHPEWYAVNKKGESCLIKPPYVKYYRWLCPSNPEVLEYLKKEMNSIAQTSGISGVHLDYVRYSDVILPKALQIKYKLVQKHEMPEFDFCYCPVCRDKFKKQTGLDPIKIKNPEENKEWIKYRWHSLTKLVNELYKEIKKYNKQVTAAVFPTPEIARNLVRQEWDKWQLDAVHPMIFHKFHNKPIEWIKEATREGVQKMGSRPLYTGLYIPELNPKELGQAIKYAKAGGAKGISLYPYKDMTEEHWKEFMKANK